MSYWSFKGFTICGFFFPFLYVNISASKGFRKTGTYAWRRKEKVNWTVERYRRWKSIARSWGMTTTIYTFQLYLAYFYCKSKFDFCFSLILKKLTNIWELNWKNPPGLFANWNFHCLYLLVCLFVCLFFCFLSTIWNFSGLK